MLHIANIGVTKANTTFLVNGYSEFLIRIEKLQKEISSAGTEGVSNRRGRSLI